MFFEDIDGIRALEVNSNRIESLELGQIRKLLKMYKIARKDLKDKLLFTPDNTFTEAKLKTMLEQINRTIVQLETRIKPELAFSFESIHEQGVEDSAKEINSFEKTFNGVSGLIPVDAILESTNPDNFLFNQYESSIMTYNQNLRNDFQRILGQSLLQGKTWSQAVNDMDSVFTGAEWILARIVRTELHQIYNVSKLNGFGSIKEQYLPDLKKTLYHPMDSRTGDDSIEMAKENLIVDLDKPFVFKYKGKVQTFFVPPNRPNDRAILIPYRESYDK